MSFFDRIKGLFSGGSDPTAAGEAGVDVEMISCHEALRLVHDYLDGELEGVPNEQVRLHFEVCQGCYPHLKLEEAFRETLRRAAEGQRAPDELRETIRQLISEAEESE